MCSKYLVRVGEVVTAGKPAFLGISEGGGSAPVRWPAWESVFSVYHSKRPSGALWEVQECALPSTIRLRSGSLLTGTQVGLCLKPTTSHSSDCTLVRGSPRFQPCTAHQSSSSDRRLLIFPPVNPKSSPELAALRSSQGGTSESLVLRVAGCVVCIAASLPGGSSCHSRGGPLTPVVWGPGPASRPAVLWAAGEGLAPGELSRAILISKMTWRKSCSCQDSGGRAQCQRHPLRSARV